MRKKPRVRSPQSRAKRPRGPKPSITLAVVRRVGGRYARGVPLVDALAAEGNGKINLETWKKALASHPEFSPHWHACKGKFLDRATKRLAEARKLTYLCWLLERRHADLFARPAAVSVSVNNQTTIAGVPEDVLGRLRAAARENARGSDKPDRTEGTDAG